MSVINGQIADQDTFNDGLISRTDTIGNDVTGVLNLLAGVFYIGGDADTDGSFRFISADGELRCQKRIAGVWTTLGAFLE